MAPPKASRPSVKLAGEGREIGGEAFAEPRVVPVLLGDRIAKPLVRDLVRQQTEGGTVGHAAFAKEDGAGVLHGAAHDGHLDVGQLFIRVRADAGGEELDGLSRGFFEGEDAVVAILREGQVWRATPAAVPK